MKANQIKINNEIFWEKPIHSTRAYTYYGKAHQRVSDGKILFRQGSTIEGKKESQKWFENESEFWENL